MDSGQVSANVAKGTDKIGSGSVFAGVDAVVVTPLSACSAAEAGMGSGVELETGCADESGPV